MAMINDEFMIGNAVGRRLYAGFAKTLPVIDYHCHLEAKAIWENRPFTDITQLWLEGDHYKWRAMRANGIPEDKITGAASAEEKFEAWALIRRSNVEVLCTTDGPLDDLQYHQRLAEEEFATRVLPTFRPDALFEADPAAFLTFTAALAQKTNKPIATLDEFLTALEARIDFFHRVGCRISDHGPLAVSFRHLGPEGRQALFARRMAGEALGEEDLQAWDTLIFIALAKMYRRRGWAMQIHFGAIRNNNARMLKKVGINSGFDSIGDQQNLAANLNGLLSAMAENDGLPKTILYNLNASYNDVVASAIANFQSGEDGIKSPLQFGSGWWFNDTRRGMVNQLSTLADQGLLANFIGMLTDSRSFVSYTRHDYFRRILCDLIGGWVERGEVPADDDILASMIRGICVDNARRYFRFDAQVQG